MTIFKKKTKRPARLQIDRKACDMARISWLAAILAQYVLPRPQVWLIIVIFGVSAAAATVVSERIGSIQPGEVLVSYSVGLQVPTVALPPEPQASATTEVQPEPKREPDPIEPEPMPEPEISKPEPVPEPPKPEPIELVMAPTVPLTMAIAEPSPLPVVSNTVAKAKVIDTVPAPAPAKAQAAVPGPGSSVAATTAGGNAGPGGIHAPGGATSGEALPAYWVSVRDAVARKLSYPYRARSRGIEGRVVISLTLDERGRVVKAEPLTKDVDEDLNRAAVNGVMRASPFAVPELVPGQKTTTAQVPIVFKLLEQEGNTR